MYILQLIIFIAKYAVNPLHLNYYLFYFNFNKLVEHNAIHYSTFSK